VSKYIRSQYSPDYTRGYIITGGMSYTLNTPSGSYPIDMGSAARWIRALREHPDWENFGFSVSRRMSRRTVPACNYCKARPAMVDHDCDSTIYRPVCDSEQCREGRH